MNRPALRIDIVSDVVCPWCIIGYLQLQRALTSLEQPFELTVFWQPFELNPQMPAEGQDIREHMQQKYGATDKSSKGAGDRLKVLGEELGFEFQQGPGRRIVNTFLAHQLLHWAGTLDAREPHDAVEKNSISKQTQLKLALFEAYFSRGEDVSRADTLLSVAAGIGLEPSSIKEALDGRYSDAVRAAQIEWREQDVHAVPAFSFDQSYPLPGAQGEENFKRFLQKILSRKQ